MSITKGIGSASLGFAAALLVAGQASAKSDFDYGPVFDTFGKHAHVEGVSFPENQTFKVALVVHGSATEEVLKTANFKERKGLPNGNETLLVALMEKGVDVIVCGQSAAAHGVEKNALIDGVKMDLSAMTAHARLAQKGYSVNPF